MDISYMSDSTVTGRSQAPAFKYFQKELQKSSSQ